jgi:hypothetical protein
MIDLNLVTEWEDPKKAKGPELRATWASLRIECANEVVTRFYDKDLNTVHHQVYGPLYPIAEWVAYHWFQILYGTDRAPERAQDLRFGAEGFALPRLRFCAEGESVRLRWAPYVHNGAKVEFLGTGEVALPRARVEGALASFLNRVTTRLQQNQISGTPLQNEWESILQLDQEEREFCIAAATLGLDPFDLPDGRADSIAQAAALLPSDLLNEFFPATEGDSVLGDAEALSAAIRHLEAKRQDNARLEELRQSIGFVDQSDNPWEAGYDLARRTRQLLGLGDGRVTLEGMLALGEPTAVGGMQGLKRIEGIVSRNGTGSASAVPPDFDHRRLESQKFSMARALSERLVLQESSTRLITKEKTSKQKLNRAFAAELLAPAEELRRRLTRREIGGEDLQELADEFEVSSFVIENQVKNHHLALIHD